MLENKKIKILLISYLPHNLVGGVEKYTYNLLKYFLKNDKYEIFDFAFMRSNELTKTKEIRENISSEANNLSLKYNTSDKAWIFFTYPNSFLKGLKQGIAYTRNESKLNKEIKKIIIENEFDVIIDNTYSGVKCLYKDINKDKTIFVQHGSPKMLLGEITRKKVQNWIIKNWIKVNKKDYILRSKNVMLYDKENLSIINKYRPVEKQGFFFAPLPYDFSFPEFKDLKIENRENIIFASRMQVDTKGIDILAEIANTYQNNIYVYGSGEGEEILKNKHNLITHGKYQNQDFPEILRKYKFFLMTSREEGFGFTLVEALSNGVPIIVRDTFPSARFLTNGGKNGFLLDASLTPKEIALKLEEIMKISDTDYQQLVQNSLEFAKEKLSLKGFNDSWDVAINTIFKNNEKK